MAEIGPDVMQVRLSRREEDRRFFTGIEIALVVGTLMVRSFWRAIATGAREAAEARGQDWGRRAVDAAFDRVEALLGMSGNGAENELPKKPGRHRPNSTK
ncbi:hypothetical protein ACFQ9X_20775 [Catenulispora yoronensis]